MSSGSEKRVRNRNLTIRLTDDERAEIDGDAHSAGLTTGSYAREVLLDAKPPRQMRRPVVERKGLARVLGALGQIGNNLNQIARALNQGDGLDRTALYGALADLRAMRDAVLRALGRDP